MTDDSENAVDALGRLPIFGALSHETITFLRRRCEEVTVHHGETFFEQGHTGDSVYVLMRGRVAVVRELEGEEFVLAEFGPGHCFGEVALVAISPRTATVRALEESHALRLRSPALFELYEHDLEQFTLLQMNLGREIARRLAQADETLFAYARRCGETTIDHALLSRAADTVK